MNSFSLTKGYIDLLKNNMYLIEWSIRKKISEETTPKYVNIHVKGIQTPNIKA